MQQKEKRCWNGVHMKVPNSSCKPGECYPLKCKRKTKTCGGLQKRALPFQIGKIVEQNLFLKQQIKEINEKFDRVLSELRQMSQIKQEQKIKPTIIMEIKPTKLSDSEVDDADSQTSTETQTETRSSETYKKESNTVEIQTENADSQTDAVFPTNIQTENADSQTEAASPTNTVEIQTENNSSDADSQTFQNATNTVEIQTETRSSTDVDSQTDDTSSVANPNYQDDENERDANSDDETEADPCSDEAIQTAQVIQWLQILDNMVFYTFSYAINKNKIVVVFDNENKDVFLTMNTIARLRNDMFDISQQFYENGMMNVETIDIKKITVNGNNLELEVGSIANNAEISIRYTGDIDIVMDGPKVVENQIEVVENRIEVVENRIEVTDDSDSESESANDIDSDSGDVEENELGRVEVPVEPKRCPVDNPIYCDPQNTALKGQKRCVKKREFCDVPSKEIIALMSNEKPLTSKCVDPTHKKYSESSNECLSGGSQNASIINRLKRELEPCDTDTITNKRVQKNRSAAIIKLRNILGDKMPEKLKILKKDDIIGFLRYKEQKGIIQTVDSLYEKCLRRCVQFGSLC